MPVPTLLQSTDLSAPVLSGEDGKLYDVLKWALPQLGWTVEFDDAVNFDIAFRNNPASGTGSYFQIRDASANHSGGGAHVAKASGFKSMSAINTGTDEFPNNGWMRKSTGPSSTAVEWFILGTDLAFYFGRKVENGRYNVFFCGDFIRASATDVSNFAILCGSDPGTGTSAEACLFNTIGPVASRNTNTASPNCLSSFDGTTGPINILYSAVAGIFTQAAAVQPGSEGSFPCPVTGNIFCSRVNLVEGTGLRGQLPGILIPMHDMSGQSTYGYSDTVPTFDNGLNKDVFFVPTDSANNWTIRYGSIFLDRISDWRNW